MQDVQTVSEDFSVTVTEATRKFGWDMQDEPAPGQHAMWHARHMQLKTIPDWLEPGEPPAGR